jgi:hypothetical protein
MRYCTSRVVRFKAKARPGESGFLEGEPPEQRGRKETTRSEEETTEPRGQRRGAKTKQSQEEREVMV